METESGKQQLVNTQALGGLFKLFANQVECVMLNACYAQVRAGLNARSVVFRAPRTMYSPYEMVL